MATDSPTIGCDKCEHIACVCDILAEHVEGCKFRLSATCAIPIECEHGRDCCPRCDPCTCATSVWVVYMLWSADTDRLYIGVSNNLARRLRQHNGFIKGGAKATRAGRPWVAVFKEYYATRSEAQKREHELKKLPREAKMRLPGVRIYIGVESTRTP